LSSPQFSSFLEGRGMISILREVRATGIVGFTNPGSTAGSPTEATFSVEPDGVPLGARLRPIAGKARADAAGALEGVRALPGTPAAGMDAARPGGARLALVPKEGAGLRTGAGVWPRGSVGMETAARGIGADKNGRGVSLARSALGCALIGERFDLCVLCNPVGLTSTGGVLRPRLDP
jgi:hypothetical protein